MPPVRYEVPPTGIFWPAGVFSSNDSTEELAPYAEWWIIESQCITGYGRLHMGKVI